jgi:GrpB-like predicted nucleotidyltransferase (UPF0157 family)
VPGARDEDVRLVPYDPAWAASFAEEAERRDALVLQAEPCAQSLLDGA